MTERPRRKQLADQVAEELQERVLKGEWKPGEKLPTEFDLIEDLNVGRGTVREAVKILVTRNVLEIRRGNGTYVVENPGQVEDPFGFAFYGDKWKLAEDLCEVRLLLEPDIAALAAKRATPEETAYILECCDAVEEQIHEGQSHSEADRAFHGAIAAASHNHVLASMTPVIQQGVSAFIEVTSSRLTQMTIRTHRKVADAIVRHDPEAASAAMREHLENNRDHIQNVVTVHGAGKSGQEDEPRER